MYISFVKRVIIARKRANTAWAMMDSFLVTKEGRWSGKSSLLSNMAELEKVSNGVGCKGW